MRRADPALKQLAIVLSVSAVCLPSSAQTSSAQELEQVIVTANRTAQKAGDMLSDTVVISSEEIQRSGQTSLVDLLHARRGIEITRNGGPGNNASVFLRGSNSNQVVLLIDGVRSVSSTGGTPDWSTVPLSSIDHIEVVLGPLATLYGADAVGGVIQVFTKKGSGAPRLSASAGAGSYGEQVITASVAGATSGEHTVRYALNASSEKADGFSAKLPGAKINPDDDGYDKRSVSGQASWALAKGQEIGLSFLNSRNEAQYDSSATYDSRTINELNTYSIYSRNQLTTNWTSLLQVSRSYTNGYTDNGTAPSIFNSRQDVASWQNDIKFGNDLLQVIAEHRLEDVSSTETALNRERTTDSLALAYQHRQGAHLISASARVDDNSDYGNHTTASVGYGYNFNSAWRIATSYGTSFRAPTFNELYYPGYGVTTNRPEKGKNAEIGLHYDDGKSTFNAVYFHNHISDLLMTAPSAECPAGYTFGCAKNVEDALLQGISLSAGTKLGSHFVLNGSLDLQNPRDETTDKLLQRRAKVHGNVSLDYVAGAWSAGSDIVFSSYRYDDAKNTASKRLGGYTLFNLHATYQVNKDWQAFARWNNVFDKSYVLAQGYQTAGSNVFVGMRYGFN